MGLFSIFNKPKQTTPFAAIGGEECVNRLANRFYDIMSSDPLVDELYEMHPQPMNEIRQVFAKYLMMWLGGPDTYVKERGHPRLRARHLPFPITPELKEQWMYCMRKAMHETVQDVKLANQLLASLDTLAEHMINTKTPG